jgi:hypothetical protein
VQLKESEGLPRILSLHFAGKHSRPSLKREAAAYVPERQFECSRNTRHYTHVSLLSDFVHSMVVQLINKYPVKCLTIGTLCSVSSLLLSLYPASLRSVLIISSPIYVYISQLIISFEWDFRFSRRQVWKWLSSWTLRRVDSYLVRDYTAQHPSSQSDSFPLTFFNNFVIISCFTLHVTHTHLTWSLKQYYVKRGKLRCSDCV